MNGLMAADTAPDFAGSGLLPFASLRAEVIRLRGLLALATEAASRQAFLLREADHRIKNSLQIVASVLGRQAAREESPWSRDVLRAAAARVLSIARIHDALQASAGEDVVDLGELLTTMCRSLQAMAGDPLAVSVIVDLEHIRAPVALAQPIALAVNELVVNALRHAFPDNRPGTVSVSVARIDGELHIVVADDGQGLPADCKEGRGFGMQLVRMMVAQIGGVLAIKSDAGTRVTLTTPAPDGDPHCCSGLALLKSAS